LTEVQVVQVAVALLLSTGPEDQERQDKGTMAQMVYQVIQIILAVVAVARVLLQQILTAVLALHLA
jgi:hypothetical protein